MTSCASVIYTQCKLFIESFAPQPTSPTWLSIICPGCLTLYNASTLPQQTMLQKSNFNKAEQKPNVCTVQHTCDLAMDVSCGIAQALGTPLRVLASFPSLALHSASHKLGRESQQESECLPWDMWFSFSFFFFFFFPVWCELYFVEVDKQGSIAVY